MNDPLIGKVIGNTYKIVEFIGKGGFGLVYKVMHLRLETYFALKFLFTYEIKDSVLIKRFEREAKTASKIGHPNIIFVTDFGVEKGIGYYFVMEYLEGEALKNRLKKSLFLSPLEALNIGIQAAGAFSEAHKNGIIHRDIKPANIFLLNKGDNKDFVKILDFGVAGLLSKMPGTEKLTDGGFLVGTPSYVSPEQVKGKDLDHRSDIYSFGIVLYEMITGEVPFKGASSYSIMKKHVSEKPIPPSILREDLKIPKELENIIMRAIAKKPSQRFQSMQDMQREMQNLYESLIKKGEKEFVILSKDEQTAKTIDMKIQSKKKGLFKNVFFLSLISFILSIIVFFSILLFFSEEKEKKSPKYVEKKYSLEKRKLEEKNQISTGEKYPKKMTMTIEVNSHPQGAYVFSKDGILIGITPFSLSINEDDETFFLKLKLNGYIDEKVSISPKDLHQSKIQHIEVFLKKLEREKIKKEKKKIEEKEKPKSPFDEL